jgi:4-hydroxy-tetrahydrodipicolinate synthase
MIANSVKLPIIMYNVPSRTGCNLLPATIVSLCNDVENIVGVKEASGNIAQVTHLMALAKGKVDVYSGNDDQIVPLLALGGKGVISVLSNIAPKQTHDICQLYFDGKVGESAKEQLRALDLIDALFCEVNPIPVKKAVNMLGIVEAGPLRRPLSEMEDVNAQKLEKAMKEYGLM